MGIGNPKTNEEQDAEQAKKESDIKKQYKEGQSRRVSSEGKSIKSGERQVSNVGGKKKR